MAELKFITAGSGAQCVMISGISNTPTWCVVSLDSPAHSLLLAVRRTGRDLVLPGWITSTVKEERLHCLIVLTMAGETRIVAMTRMLVWFVTLSLQ